MAGSIDFDGLKSALLDQAETLLPRWFPNGVLRGNEFHLGSINGEKGQSLRFNIKKGYGKDYATGEGFGDMIAMHAGGFGLGMVESARECAKEIGFGNGSYANYAPLPIVTRASQAPKARDDFYRSSYGLPSEIYTYNTGYKVCRYDPPDGGKKSFLPFTLDDEGDWVAKAPEAPRPLYNLSEVLHTNKPVLITEGEKACEAAAKIAGDIYACITWPGGSNGWGSIDWAPVYGRRVLIWPDADAAGIKAGRSIAGLLHPHCPSVKIFAVPHDGGGWDAADCLAKGWDKAKWRAWGKDRVKVFQPPVAPTPMPEPKPEPVEVTVLPKDPADPNAEEPSQQLYKRWELCQLDIGRNNQPKFNADSCHRILTNWGQFSGFVWFDEFYSQLFTSWDSDIQPLFADWDRHEGREWTDNDTRNLTIYFQRFFGFHGVKETHVWHAVQTVAWENKRNEPCDWFKSLTWDLEPRIDTFFPVFFGCPDTEYSRSVSKNFWLSLVARALSPGCKVDTMVVLEGEQGAYKSTACDIIGGKWFAESNEAFGHKDFYIVLQGKILVEIADLDSFNKADLNTIKKVITCRSDRFRGVWDKTAKDWPRKCVFIGTTNEHAYLRDPTGARRFWPIKVSNIDLKGLKLWRDQFYAEAINRFHEGETWYQMPKIETQVEQELRREVDPWENYVLDYLIGETEISMNEISKDALKLEPKDMHSGHFRRIGKILGKYGWENKVVRYGKTTARRWRKVEDDK